MATPTAKPSASQSNQARRHHPSPQKTAPTARWGLSLTIAPTPSHHEGDPSARITHSYYALFEFTGFSSSPQAHGPPRAQSAHPRPQPTDCPTSTPIRQSDLSSFMSLRPTPRAHHTPTPSPATPRYIRQPQAPPKPCTACAQKHRTNPHPFSPPPTGATSVRPSQTTFDQSHRPRWGGLNRICVVKRGEIQALHFLPGPRRPA